MELYKRFRINDSQIGERFGEWTQVGPSFSVRVDYKHKHRYAVCECSCGATSAMRLNNLRSNSVSYRCQNCYFNDLAERKLPPEYDVWINMIHRCTNPTASSYKDYGGRGIRVCERWLHSFDNFLADMGSRPTADHQIDRYPNNDGNYEPSNCRWATRKQNGRNTRKSRWLTYQGRTMTLAELSEITGIPTQIIHGRIRMGWTVDRAVSVSYQPRQRSVI